MADELTQEEALEIIRSAFAPFRCIAEDTDYHYFRFRVFSDDDDGILKAPKLTKAEIGSRKALAEVISNARSMVEEQGYALEHWTMPPDASREA